MSRVNLALRLSVLVFLSIVALMVAVDWIIGLSVPGDRRPALLLFVSVALIGGLIVAFALDRMVVKPIQSTIGQVRSTSNEDWRKVIEPQGGPEMQELGHALEQLRADLVAERDQLERRVEERTEQLRGDIEAVGDSSRAELQQQADSARAELEGQAQEAVGEPTARSEEFIGSIHSRGEEVIGRVEEESERRLGMFEETGNRWREEFDSIGGEVTERKIRLRGVIEDIVQAMANEVPAVGPLLAGLADQIDPYD